MHARWRLCVSDVPLIALAAIVLAGLIGGTRDGRGACLWDSDTLRTESKDAPGAIEAIVGRFDQYPPLYYEMRLARVEREVPTNPDDLGLYDDAGVACDRLGRSEEAIAWMARKAEAMARREAAGRPDADHRYRYLANLGTFHAHRWVSGGKDRNDLTDLHEARRLIAAAIALNPQAHFGRERYQLLFIEWLLDPPLAKYPDFGWTMGIFATKAASGSGAPDPFPNDLQERGFDDAEAGIRGLITLGSAWQSVDAFEAYALALESDAMSSLAFLAGLRAQELLDSGLRSAHPDREESDDQATWAVGAPYLREGVQKDAVRAYFAEARAEADAWRAARRAYIMERLEAGRHPDTDRDFWAAWIEPSRMPVPPGGFFGYAGTELMILKVTLVVGGVLLVLFAGSTWFFWRLIRRRQRATMPQ